MQGTLIIYKDRLSSTNPRDACITANVVRTNGVDAQCARLAGKHRLATVGGQTQTDTGRQLIPAIASVARVKTHPY